MFAAFVFPGHYICSWLLLAVGKSGKKAREQKIQEIMSHEEEELQLELARFQQYNTKRRGAAITAFDFVASTVSDRA